MRVAVGEGRGEAVRRLWHVAMAPGDRRYKVAEGNRKSKVELSELRR